MKKECFVLGQLYHSVIEVVVRGGSLLGIPDTGSNIHKMVDRIDLALHSGRGLLESGSKQMTKLSRFEATCLSSRERMTECEEEGKITLLHTWRCWSRLGEVD